MDMEATATPRPHRFTVADYYRMADAGILGPHDRVELIEGEIVEMPPIGPAHTSHVSRFLPVLSRMVEGRAIVWPPTIGR
ncbi:MAG TPA: Uma2 family endonuclease [Actinomycetota bacterium]